MPPTRLLLLLLLVTSPVFADGWKYDSLSFYPDGKLAFARMVSGYQTREYAYYPSGLLQWRETRVNGALANRHTFYPNGKREFDTIFSAHQRASCTRYYPDGAMKSERHWYFPLKWSSPVASEWKEWDVEGQLSYYRQTDTSGAVVADEAYPNRKFEGLKLYRSYFASGYLNEQGFYSPDSTKYGAWFRFHENGRLAFAGLFMADVPWGLHIVYDTSGAVTETTYYEKGKVVSGEPGGEITAYNEIEKTATWQAWRWRKFCWEGVYDYVSPEQKQRIYFFHGGMLATIPDPRPQPADPWKTRRESFGFPLFDMWNTYGCYSLMLYSDGRLAYTRDAFEGITCSYTKEGFPEKKGIHSRREQLEYHYNGTLKQKERTDFYDGWFLYNSWPNRFNCDTTFHYDSKGNLRKYEVYGTRGQVRKYAWVDKQGNLNDSLNTLYQHFYVRLPGGKRVEIFNNDATLNGYWEFVTERGVVAMEGRYDSGREGKWIERNAKTGKKKLVMNYDDNYERGRGVCKKYDENGKLSEKGHYNRNGSKKGVWKNYSGGKKRSRERYIDGDLYGFYTCRKCCNSKKGRARLGWTFYWNDNHVFSRKCHRSRGPWF